MPVSEDGIASIQLELHSMLVSGITPPKTSCELMTLFGKFGTKMDITQVFEQGKVTWPSYMEAPSNYQTIMNKSMIYYLSHS